MSKVRPNPLFPDKLPNLSRELGVLWRELATAVNGVIDSIDGTSTGGSGGGGSGSKWRGGIDTTQDIIIDSTTSGLVLLDTAGHYWRVTISTAGALTTTDLGTVKP